ncbi:MAG: hypothetical protein RLZ98_698 [Pseudomonadota bacterium]|jgi:alkylation response protein AidB-like acyl-CoA dehydrogenase
MSALHGAGLFRMLLPRSAGGGEVSPQEFIMAVEAIAGADASTGWCVGQGSGCSLAAAYLDPEIAEQVFGPSNAILAWGPTPKPENGRAVVVDGGYRVTGSWQFASGSRHATWLGGHCFLRHPDGSLIKGDDGAPVERTMLFERGKARISDVWQVMGLKGTGSDSYVVEDLYVPAGYAFKRDNLDDKRAAGPLYRFTTLNIYGMAFASVALGIGRAMLSSFIELAGSKTPHASRKLLRDSSVVQADVAQAEAKLASARAFLLEVVGDMWATAQVGEPFSVEQRARLRLGSTFAIHQAKDVVDTCYSAAGATAIFESQPFERRFRDMHAVTQQVQAQAQNFELVGQALLGLPASPRL